MPEKGRIFGLDIIRAMAILFVLYEHAAWFISPELRSLYNLLRLDGVSIFFVLSGFLIGNILIRHFELRESSLLHFWKRRWLRTLPNYYLVLGLNIILSFLINEIVSGNVLEYIFFIQNFAKPHPPFFPEAWTLAIEEWFYISIPILLHVLIYGLKIQVRHAFLSLTIFIIILSLIIRYIKYSELAPLDYVSWDQYLRKQVITRFDSIMFGVAAAYFSTYYKQKWIALKNKLLLVGILLLIVYRLSLIHAFANGRELYMSVLSFSVFSAGCSCLLPYFSELRHGKGIFYRAITFTSIISYALYLVNVPVMRLISNSRGNEDILNYPLFWLGSFAAAGMLYFFYEKHFLTWRDR